MKFAFVLTFLLCVGPSDSFFIPRVLAVAAAVESRSTFITHSRHSSSVSSSSSSNDNHNNIGVNDSPPIQLTNDSALPISDSSSSTAEPPHLSLSPPKKVLLMVEPTPFTHVSGYANRFKEMLKFLSKAGDNVEILTVDSTTPAEKHPRKFLNYPITHTQGFKFPLYNQISLSTDIVEGKGLGILRRFKPDLIHASSPGFMVFAAIMYSRFMRLPLLISYHTHLPIYALQYIRFIPFAYHLCWAIIRWTHRRADLTLVTSPQMQQELVSNGIPRVEVWRKGIDTERFDPKFKSAEMRNKMSDGNPNDFLMVYVGRLGAEKRIMDVKPILEKMPNARFCVVGKGPQMKQLQSYFEGTKTKFMGQLSGDELSQAFASADVFVMPSDSETLGFVVLESMASGVPVVGAKAGGIPHLIHDEDDGFLVEPGNTDGFVARLKQLEQESFRTEMGIRARKEAERWGWEAATSLLRNVQYEKAVANYNTLALRTIDRFIRIWVGLLNRLRAIWPNAFQFCKRGKPCEEGIY